MKRPKVTAIGNTLSISSNLEVVGELTFPTRACRAGYARRDRGGPCHKLFPSNFGFVAMHICSREGGRLCSLYDYQVLQFEGGIPDVELWSSSVPEGYARFWTFRVNNFKNQDAWPGRGPQFSFYCCHD